MSFAVGPIRSSSMRMVFDVPSVMATSVVLLFTPITPAPLQPLVKLG